ncbi:MAG: hypothetical protein K6U79_06120 [Firmicutes bacterium]|nr:hypothetical protein [Bacillota bacterium]
MGEEALREAAERRAGFTRRVREGAPLAGTFLHFPSPELVEMAGLAGYDFVLLDGEHGAPGEAGLAELLRAGDAAGLPCVVRLPDGHPKRILKALDLGAAGILVPQVESAEEAAAVARAARFPPAGERSLAPVVRASGYSALDARAFVRAAEEAVSVWVQVETRAGVEAAEAIAATPGVDLLFIGPVDLSTALGHPGEPDHPEVEAAIDAVTAAARRAGKPVGSFAVTPEQAAFYRAKGVRLLASSLTVTLLRALREEAAWLQAALRTG